MHDYSVKQLAIMVLKFGCLGILIGLTLGWLCVRLALAWQDRND